MKWLYYQKYIKPGNFESSNSKTKPYQYLKISFKICWFVNFSLTKKLIFLLFLRNLEDSIDFSNFFVSGYLHQFKTILLHIFMISWFKWRRDFCLHVTYLLKNLTILVIIIHSFSYFFFVPFVPRSFLWQKHFYAVSFDVDMVLSIHSFVNIFVFISFNIQYKLSRCG